MLMRSLFIILSVWITVVKCKAQYNAYQYENGQPYAHYLAYFGQHPNFYYYQYPSENRLFWGLTSLFTTTTTTTSTSTTTCTVSVANACARRKRDLLERLLEDESIQPTAVNKVETTKSVDMDSTRNQREANSQIEYWRDAIDSYRLYEPQSTIGPNYHYANPNNFFQRQPIIPDPARFGFYLFTFTATQSTTVTSRSTPACSKASSFNAC